MRIDGEITKINGLIDVLFTDLSNLITGLIVQDYSDFNAVFAQVAKYNVTPNETGKTYYVNNTTEQEAYFPYKGATGGDQRHINNYTVQPLILTLYLLRVKHLLCLIAKIMLTANTNLQRL